VFYRELLNTQRVLYSKHLNWRTAPGFIHAASSLMLRGQFNFVRGMMLYPRVYNIEKMLRDHEQPVNYEIQLPPPHTVDVKASAAKSTNLYVQAPRGRAGRHIDDSTEQFVDTTRMSAAQ